MKNSLKNLVKHVLIIIGFAVLAILYFNPVLQGKEIIQSDIVQYTGMAKQMNDIRDAYDEETYWIDSAFVGMPTYQLGVNYPYNFVKKFDRLLRFLPRPADYLFLYLVCFYFLMLTITNDFRLSLIGALAFGFSTYLIVIIGGGHNSKAHAIAYMPLVLSGILLVFKKRYLIGFLVTTIGLALEINANHFQMTYYLLLLVLVLGICFFIDAFSKKKLRQFFISVSVLFGALFLSMGLNSTNILATQEYVKDTTRGKSELTINPDGSPKENSSGLSKAYITQWSYGISETFNLFIPRFMGGRNSEQLDKNSASYKTLLKHGASPSEALKIVETQIPTYWGEQPWVLGPAYIGASILLLFFLSFFLVKGKTKWWLTSTIVLTLLLSYGHNFELLTNFFIDYIPLYNKFRAVSSIQVIVELCVPILAIIGLQKLLDNSIEQTLKLKALKYTFIGLGGLTIFFLIFKSVLFDFVNSRELDQLSGPNSDLLSAIIDDRKDLFSYDAWRTLVLISIFSGVIWMYLKNRLSEKLSLILFAIIVLFDLVGVDRRYVNNENFTTSRTINNYFRPSQADKEILKDTSDFRVYDMSSGFFTGKASYLHNSIGGYHAAQPKRIQELYEFYLSKGNIEVLNMLNVKYLIKSSENGRPDAVKNPLANGNAWFITKLNLVDTANKEILALEKLNTKESAIVRKDTWLNFLDDSPQKFERYSSNEFSFAIGQENYIKLVSDKPDHLIYNSKNEESAFAVFSENFYQPGWQAFLNGKPVEHLRVNYTLRGLPIPAGIHTIEFKFIPKVIETGSGITIVSLVIFILVLISLLYLIFRKKNPEISN